jgi:hypothetical protein
MSKCWTIGQISLKFGLLPWQVDYAMRRVRIKESGRAGRYRFWNEDMIPAIEKALADAGYIAKGVTANA